MSSESSSKWKIMNKQKRTSARHYASPFRSASRLNPPIVQILSKQTAADFDADSWFSNFKSLYLSPKTQDTLGHLP